MSIDSRSACITTVSSFTNSTQRQSSGSAPSPSGSVQMRAALDRADSAGLKPDDRLVGLATRLASKVGYVARKAVWGDVLESGKAKPSN